MQLQTSNPSGQAAFGFNQDSWTLTLFVSISVALHLLLVLAIIFVPRFRPARRFDLPAAVNVRMVSLQGPGKKTAPKTRPSPAIKKPAEPEPVVEKKPPPKPKQKKAISIPEKKVELPKPPPPVPEVKKAISISPKKIKKKKYKPKRSLKRKTYKKKTIQETIKKLEKKVKDSDSQRVKRALARIRKEVARTSPVDRLKRKMANQGQGAAGKPGGGGLGGGRRAIEMMDIYRADIPYRIQENWAFPSQLAGEARHLKAVIVIKIMPNGEITDIWFEKRSGNQYLDDSAYKATKKSSPLPPLPPGYRRPFYNLGLVFTPEGVQ